MAHNWLTLTPIDAPLAAALSDDWQQVARDWLTNFASPGTRRAYRAAWVDFLGYVRLPPAAVTQSDVLGYRQRLEHDPSPYTGQPCGGSTSPLASPPSICTPPTKREIASPASWGNGIIGRTNPNAC